jgi:putative ABC transport system permease protein
MIHAALRDLAWRRRRVIIAVIAVGLAFGVSLVMSGVASAFDREARRTLAAIGGESFLMRSGELGVFTTASVVPTSLAPDARPFAFWNSPIRSPQRGLVQSALIGIPYGWPRTVDDGEQLRGPGEVVVDETLGVKIGESITLADQRFTVVGTIRKTTLYGGQPVVFVPMPDAQVLLAGGADVTKGFVENGRPTTPPPDGLIRVDQATARSDLLRPLANAQQSLVLIMVLLWTVAAAIVASVVFLSVIERTRDIAVFKATGVQTKSIAAGIVVQALVVALAAALIGVVFGYALAPAFQMPVDITMGWTLAVPVVAVLLALLASMIGLRRIGRIEPALAFGAAP